MKFNLQKQMLFILDDYLEHYVYSLVNGAMLHEISVSKQHAQTASSVENNALLRRTKLRHMIYKRLLEDFSFSSKYKRTGKTRRFLDGSGLVPGVRIRRVSVYLCTRVPVYPCIRVSVFPCIRVPV